MGWNIKYPYQNDEILNLDWVLDKLKSFEKNLDELEARVLAAAIAASKEYVDQEMAEIRAEFDDLSREVADFKDYFDTHIEELNDEFDRKIAALQSDYDTFTNAVQTQFNILIRRIEAFEEQINAAVIGMTALMDLKIEANNEYILDEVARGIVNVKVLNYFTGDIVTIQQMFDTLAQLHLENPITYNELDAAAITYTAYAALNMTYTELAIKGKSFIAP